MTSETIEKIREFYRPEYNQESHDLSLLIGGKRHDIQWRRKYTFTFGAKPKPKDEAEAAERGFPTVTGRDLFQAFAPEDFEAIRKTREIDARTEAYLASTKRHIGLVGRKDGYDGEKLGAPEKMSLGKDLVFGTVEADLGRLPDGRWVVEWSQRTDIDDYNITDLYFDHKPTSQEVWKAILIEQIESDLAWKYRYNPGFTCYECGRHTSHWLDIRAETLAEQWDRFKERYCGC